jgi:senataxin
MYLVEVIDTFRDYCQLGPPLFATAYKVQNLLLQIYQMKSQHLSSTLAGDNQMWMKTWPFIDSILTSCVSWAKQDMKFKNDVKKIVKQTFLLSDHLLSFRIVINSPRAAELAKTPLAGAVIAAVKWLKVLADDLREDAVNCISNIIEFTRRTSVKVDTAVLETLKNHCMDLEKNHMTDRQKRALLACLQNERRPSISASSMYDSAAYGQKRPAGPISDLELDVSRLAKLIKPVSSESSSSTSLSRPSEHSFPIQSKLVKPVNAVQVPAPAVKKPTKSSKIAQMRYEHNLDVRRTTIDLATRKMAASINSRISDDDGDDEDGKSHLKSLADDASPLRPKRTVQLLDSSNNVVDLSEHKKQTQAARTAVKTPGKKQGPIKNFNDFCKIFLLWNIDSETSDKPPNFNFDLVPIPERFSSPHHYASVFEPLLLLECWEQFKAAKEYTDFSKGILTTFSSCCMIDDFIGKLILPHNLSYCINVVDHRFQM